MDPITHGFIGASASLSFAERKNFYLASITGAAGAMFPDLDVLISSNADPLLQLEFHRQLTHSLLFIPAGAAIVAGIFWLMFNKRATFKAFYLYSLLGMATAGFSDAFTSYGVQLLWPISAAKFSWNLVAVFDPLFSLGIIIAVVAALYRKKRLFARIAFIWISAYLLFAILQQQRAQTAITKLAEQRGHTIQRMIAKPTIGNELLWGVRYTHDDTLYTYGVNLLPFAEPYIYTGKAIKLLDWRSEYQQYKGTTLYNDIARFAELSDGILIAHPDANHLIGDGRYSMLPTTVTPLWGIEVDTTRPGTHVDFNTYRNAGPKVINKFIDMILRK